MSVCVYDNPNTATREAWSDGEIVASISMSLMHTEGFDGHPNLPFMLNVGRDFIKGNIIGDPEAMK